MPVLPLVGSIKTVLPVVIFPAFSASLIMLTPIRSLTLAQGLKLSSFATTVAPTPFVTLFRRTSGVLPMRSVMSLAIFMSHLHWIKTVGSLGKFQGFREPQTTKAGDNNNSSGNQRGNACGCHHRSSNCADLANISSRQAVRQTRLFVAN